MGNKRLKAVAIVRGSKALRAADPRGLWMAAQEIAEDLQYDPSTRSLYEYGTLPGVSGLSRLGALPIKNYTTNVVPEDVDMSEWTAQGLREGFDHRGHQCNSCGMHHCHAQVLPSGPHQGAIVDEPEYEGWSGAGWAFGCTDPVATSWLNTQVDRACVDVNEFGWLVGWVAECQEKGYITKEQLGGITLTWGDAEAANAVLQMVIRREGFGDVLAEGVKGAAERLGGPAAECAIYTLKGNTPRGHDHRARWEEMLDTCTGSGGTLDSGPPVLPTEMGQPARINPFDPDAVARMVGGTQGTAAVRGLLGHLHLYHSRAAGHSLPNPERRNRMGFHQGRGAPLRPPHRRPDAGIQSALRYYARTGKAIQALWLHTGRRPCARPEHRGALGSAHGCLVRRGRL